MCTIAGSQPVRRHQGEAEPWRDLGSASAGKKNTQQDPPSTPQIGFFSRVPNSGYLGFDRG